VFLNFSDSSEAQTTKNASKWENADKSKQIQKTQIKSGKSRDSARKSDKFWNSDIKSGQ
jgi:hypothetical protein